MSKQLHGLNCKCGLMDSLGVANNTKKMIGLSQQFKYKWLPTENGDIYHEVDLPNGTLISYIKHNSARGCFDSYMYLTCKKCFDGKLKISSTSSGW